MCCCNPVFFIASGYSGLPTLTMTWTKAPLVALAFLSISLQFFLRPHTGGNSHTGRSVLLVAPKPTAPFDSPASRYSQIELASLASPSMTVGTRGSGTHRGQVLWIRKEVDPATTAVRDAAAHCMRCRS
eukprot:4431408-Prymnesium_polylepis.1